MDTRSLAACNQIGCVEQGLLVAVTGFTQPADRVRCAEAGFDLHLAKPVDFDLLEHVFLLRQRSRQLAMTQGKAMVQVIRETINMGNTLLNVAATTRNENTRRRCLAKVDKSCPRLPELIDGEVTEREYLVWFHYRRAQLYHVRAIEPRHPGECYSSFEPMVKASLQLL